MKRIYFLLPKLETAARIVDILLLARVEERKIHVLARRGTPLKDLPAASFIQTTDFIPALGQGLAVGSVTGFVGCLTAAALPIGVALSGGTLLTASLLGAGLGAWCSSLIGASVPSRRLKEYEEAIDRGKLLVMVDVPKGRVEVIEDLIRNHCPDVECRGIEPMIPCFP